MKKILMISFSDLKNDPRVRRHINFLKEKYFVHAVGYENPEIDGVRFTKVSIKQSDTYDKIQKLLQLSFRNFDKYYWGKYDFSQVFKIVGKEKFDVIIANDANTLPLAFKLKGDAKIVFDAHEYAPLEFEDSLYWRWFFKPLANYICQKYIKHVDAMITVGEIIAKEYEKNFNVAPIVITNASGYKSDLKPVFSEGEKIRIIHNGSTFPSRKIEVMIEVMKYLDDKYELYLMLLKNDIKYLSKLKNLSVKMKNVFFLEPVSNDKVIEEINKYDVGLHILAPTNFNNASALPNKFFEFIQARLAIVIGPSPEMANILKRYNLGLVSEDFTPLKIADTLKKLNRQNIYEFKINADKAAFELSAEANKIKLQNLIGDIIGE
jgi:hypothetical protein